MMSTKPEAAGEEASSRRRELVLLLAAWAVLAAMIVLLAKQNLSVPGDRSRLFFSRCPGLGRYRSQFYLPVRILLSDRAVVQAKASRATFLRRFFCRTGIFQQDRFCCSANRVRYCRHFLLWEAP